MVGSNSGLTTRYFFIRVNGDTAHNNPNEPDCFVLGEPPIFPKTFFNYLEYCFAENIVRIGWPDTGDLTTTNRHGTLSSCYDINTVKPHIRKYLLAFVTITPPAIILVPNKNNPEDIYIARAESGYVYHYNPPNDPYECSHRLQVQWDRAQNAHPILYSAQQLGISIYGGFWLRAFHEIVNQDVINAIISARSHLSS